MTVNDVDNVTEMNSTNINVNPETGEEYNDDVTVQGIMITHGDNLHPRTVKPRQQFDLLKISQQ